VEAGIVEALQVEAISTGAGKKHSCFEGVISG